MLSNQQIETFIYQQRIAIENLQAAQLAQNTSINQLQQQLNTLVTSVQQLSGQNVQVNNSDSYPSAGGILHKLRHTFLQLVTFVSDVAVQGTLTLANALAITSGGTGGITAAAARFNLGAAALPQSILGSNFTYPGQTSTACGGSQVITIPGSAFTAPIAGGPCTGSFSVTVNGSNFNFTVSSVTNSGTQALV